MCLVGLGEWVAACPHVDSEGGYFFVGGVFKVDGVVSTWFSSADIIVEY